MDSLKFTIVTPSYNQGTYLEQTISSVIRQGYPCMEYGVIDGGSTDISVDVIRQHSNAITFWMSEKDHGQADAINKGFRRATGDIVAWINSDDVYSADAFNTVASVFDENKDVEIVYGNCHVIDKTGAVIGEERSENFDLSTLLLGNRLPQPATFFRRSVLEEVGYLREDLHYSFDYEYWLRCALAGKRFKHIDTTLASFRIHDSSKTELDATRFNEDTFRFLEEIFSTGPPLDISTETYRQLSTMCRNDSEPLYHLLFTYRNGKQSLNEPNEVKKRLTKMGLNRLRYSGFSRIVGRHFINAFLHTGSTQKTRSGIGMILTLIRFCPLFLVNGNALRLLVNDFEPT